MDQDFLARIARQVQEKYYGKYRGFVQDNKDPEQRARLRLTVPSVLGEAVTHWAEPCLPFGGIAEQGLFVVPEREAQVWVEFEEGALSRPIWTGTFWPRGGIAPTEARQTPPTTRLLKTPGGHILQFDDKEHEEAYRLHHPTGAETTVDKNGTVTITDAKGAKVTLDAKAPAITIEDANGNTLKLTADGATLEDKNGNQIEMAAGRVTVKGTKVVVQGDQVMLGGQGGEPIIKGQSFLTLFATHVHPTPVGPSGPPVPQGEMSTLSMKVMGS